MEYCGTLIVVKNCKKAFEFYHNVFGLNLIANNNGNMQLDNHIFLQEEKYWQKFLNKKTSYYSNSCELYFNENNIELFVKKLKKLYPNIKFVNELMVHTWGQTVTRFYDLDGNLIEVGSLN